MIRYGNETLHVLVQDPTGEAASQAQKHLTYYELDFGLNHVARKWSDPVDNGANLLIPVPGGGDGPGGVLVCADNFIIYKDQDHAEVRIPAHIAVLSVLIFRLYRQPPCNKSSPEYEAQLKSLCFHTIVGYYHTSTRLSLSNTQRPWMTKLLFAGNDETVRLEMWPRLRPSPAGARGDPAAVHARRRPRRAHRQLCDAQTEDAVLLPPAGAHSGVRHQGTANQQCFCMLLIHAPRMAAQLTNESLLSRL